MATYYDLSDDARLAEGPEEEGEAASDDDHQADLQDDERQRVAEWIVAVPRPIRGHRWRRRATTARRRHAPAPYFFFSLRSSIEYLASRRRPRFVGLLSLRFALVCAWSNLIKKILWFHVDATGRRLVEFLILIFLCSEWGPKTDFSGAKSLRCNMIQ